MNTLATFLREAQRLLRERITLLAIAFTVLGAIWFCLNSSGKTAADAYVLIPAENTAILGALLFTMLTLIQFHRDFKNNTDSIVFTCTDSIIHQVRRTLALVGTAILTALAVTLFTLPYTLLKSGPYFQAATFAASWFIIFLGALVITILLSAGWYMFFKRADVAFIIMAALMMFSILLKSQHELHPSYLFFWLQTNTQYFSDLVSNQFWIDLILWNRLFCLLAALGVWLLGLCCFRRYGFGVLGSLIINCKRIWLPVLLVTTVALSGVSYAAEPVFDNSIPIKYQMTYDSETGICTAVATEKREENIDLILHSMQVKLDIDTDRRMVTGKAVFTLENPSGASQRIPILVNTGYTINNILVNGQPTPVVRSHTEKEGNATWHIDLPADRRSKLELCYYGKIKNSGSLGQIPFYGINDELVWLPGTGFSPCVCIKVADTCDFSATCTLDEYLIPILTRGEAKKINTVKGKTEWKFSGAGIESIGLTAARYHTRFFEAGGLKVKFIYFAKHEEEVRNMDSVNVMKAAIDYFTKAYGKLPYQDHLIILELPASVGGGFAAGNTSAMDETVFGLEGYLPANADTPGSGSGVDVLVHEIAHQWWGLATFPVPDQKSNWSAEGITCYSTYRFMQYYYGEEYAQKHYVAKWEANWNNYRNAFYIQNPEYLAKLSEKDASNVLGTFKNICRYDIMPLEIIKAEAAAGSPKSFQVGLSKLYHKYLFSPITYDDFLSVTAE